MRLISFSLTTDQVREGFRGNVIKDVTRRIGWLHAKPGQRLLAVEKAMGLRKGESPKGLGYIEIVSVRREPLQLMLENVEYGFEECRREGFGEHPVLKWPSEFATWLCNRSRIPLLQTDPLYIPKVRTTRQLTERDPLARIEFRYVK